MLIRHFSHLKAKALKK